MDAAGGSLNISLPLVSLRYLQVEFRLVMIEKILCGKLMGLLRYVQREYTVICIF
jgi:hypothetical protein